MGEGESWQGVKLMRRGWDVNKCLITSQFFNARCLFYTKKTMY